MAVALGSLKNLEGWVFSWKVRCTKSNMHHLIDDCVQKRSGFLNGLCMTRLDKTLGNLLWKQSYVTWSNCKLYDLSSQSPIAMVVAKESRKLGAPMGCGVNIIFEFLVLRLYCLIFLSTRFLKSFAQKEFQFLVLFLRILKSLNDG